MKRGFKSWCENVALQYRKDLNLEEGDPLDPIQLSNFLGIKVFTPEEINGVAEDIKEQLIQKDSDSWSAVAICINQQHLIIHNNSHSKGRQSNNIMHELAHIIIGHKSAQNCFSLEAEVFLRYYDQEQEEEADWLAATLLLPKPALFKIKKNSQSLKISAKEFQVSHDLLNYRLNVSGVNLIYNRRKQKNSN